MTKIVVVYHFDYKIHNIIKKEFAEALKFNIFMSNNIKKLENAAIDNLVSGKSRERYENEFSSFTKWKREKSFINTDEDAHELTFTKKFVYFFKYIDYSFVIFVGEAESINVIMVDVFDVEREISSYIIYFI